MRRKRSIIVIIILVGLLTAVGSLLMNVVSGGIVLPLWVSWPLLAVVICAGIGLAVWQYLLEEPIDPAIQNDLNRERLLEIVKAIWINGVLEKSLYNVPSIVLELRDQPEAVENPWKFNSKQPSQSVGPLPSSSKITQIYNDAGGELLILGEPGSGKTTLLLQLTRDLLVHAGQQKEFRMPVVFNLSSWAVKQQQELKDWLVEELNGKYYVPRPLAQSWVDDDKILPLLDGLDEVTSFSQVDCVKAINTYRREHGLVPMVVCCRAAEFDDLATRILLLRAVVVQPLTAQQIDEGLANAGGKFATIRVALREDQELQELVKTPLMLSILPLAYEGISVDSLPRTGSTETRRQQVFKQYILCMLERKKSMRYKPDQTLCRLIWLAEQMKQHKHAVFYLERMQVDWLSTCWSQRLYHGLTLGPIGALIGLLLSLLIGVLTISYSGLLVFGLIGLCTGMILSSWTIKMQSVGPIPWSWRSLMKIIHLRIALGTGFATGLVVGMINDSLKGIGPVAEGADVLEVGLIGALIGVLSSILLTYKRTIEIEPAEHISWSRPDFLKFDHLRKGLDVGLVVGLANVLIFGQLLVFGHLIGPFSVLLHGLTYVLLGTLFSTLLIGLFTSLSSKMNKDSHVKPNEGMRRSVRNGVKVGLVVGLLFGLVSGLCLGLVSGVVGRWENVLAEAVTTALFYGLIGGLLSGLRFGGDACIRHTVLHILLWFTRSIPWNYPDFLDYAATCVLLRKVGGGYDFGNQLLLDYFASSEARLILSTITHVPT